ncbi:fasciclin domain-containing protein [Algoriphagus sp. CAU 1675]|uniref:fasciclin domain-containing protein n=1 Tax=Algoriphagus sp. CAU 1675 TaxID=3032597 RepID=UPI0023DA6AF4|nr:fasciclin domain-containing protein [Algoriphagus sp. CAU 1675]MDF2157789.1 fasciclin domain-containing protein [Algoriphagus sp. CAU 1675]
MKKRINRLLPGSFLIGFLIFFGSCTDMEQSQVTQDMTLKSIPEVLKTMEKGDEGDLNARKSAGNTYATFNAALGSSGLASVFAQNELTVFAPNDAAFAELGLNPGNIRSLPNLTEILLYHVVGGTVLSTDLMSGFVPTLNGAAVQIDVMTDPMVNDASIILVDKMARNGVIHGIDAVLMPPTKNILELVESNADFSILKTAIEAAGVGDILANTDGLTVFAPDNDAFVALLGEYGFADLNEVVAALGQEGLVRVLAYHVFDGGRVFSSDLSDTSIEMFSGDQLTIDTSGPKLIDFYGRESMILDTDIQATNGVVHVINQVVLPEVLP